MMVATRESAMAIAGRTRYFGPLYPTAGNHFRFYGKEAINKIPTQKHGNDCNITAIEEIARSKKVSFLIATSNPSGKNRILSTLKPAY
jgi:hypothetical protein